MPDSFLTSVLKDRYQLQKQLGRKSGRRTLLAFDRETQQSVILKVLLFSRDTAWEEVRLFQREAELLQTLSHPSIPEYIDAFEFETVASKGYATVQSYIKAPSLEDNLNAGRYFGERDVRRILESVLEILSYLHQRQPPVIHRDIKPSNILLSDRTGDSPGQVYLVDFGSVQTLASRAGKTLTVVGTYGYMPPEQFSNVACPASDLYSLGATAIALLTRTHPADNPTVELRGQLKAQILFNLGLRTLLQQMIDPDVSKRPASAQEALQLLKSPNGSQRPAHQRKHLWVPATPTQLLIDAIWRSTRRGALTGAIMLAIYPGLIALVVMPIGLPLLVLLGMSVGAIFGGINGLVLGIWTRLFHFPLTRFENHRFDCTIVSFLAGCVSSLWLFTVFYPLAMLLVGALMGLSSYKTVSWWYRAR